MVYVGIDVAKDKHDCFIVNSDGEVLYDVFTIQNNMDGFEDLKKRSEGKHYYVALSHAAKKLVRLLYHLETTGEKYKPASV